MQIVWVRIIWALPMYWSSDRFFHSPLCCRRHLEKCWEEVWSKQYVFVMCSWPWCFRLADYLTLPWWGVSWVDSGGRCRFIYRELPFSGLFFGFLPASVTACRTIFVMERSLCLGMSFFLDILLSRVLFAKIGWRKEDWLTRAFLGSRVRCGRTESCLQLGSPILSFAVTVSAQQQKKLQGITSLESGLYLTILFYTTPLPPPPPQKQALESGAGVLAVLVPQNGCTWARCAIEDILSQDWPVLPSMVK